MSHSSSPKFSFMSANFLGREKNYRNVTGFGEGRTSVADHYSPADTYAERIDEMLGEVAAMGFQGIDLWTAHCDPAWMTPSHIKGLRSALDKHQLFPTSIAGGLHTLETLEATTQLAQEIGCPTLGLGCNLLPDQIEIVHEILVKYDVQLAFENHPNEPTPEIVLDKIKNGAYSHIGSTFDTGWWGTHNYPVLDALEKLRKHILLVHLKNVKETKTHIAAPFENGLLDLNSILLRLREIGYSNWISLEYEPLDEDPTEKCKEYLEKAKQLWNS